MSGVSSIRHVRRRSQMAAAATLLAAMIAIGTGAGTGSAASPRASSPQITSSAVFVNELHYDNVGTDVDEGVEVAGPAGTDLSGYSVALYNGYDGRLYRTTALSGSLGDEQAGFGTRFFAISGLQNGAPDGLALVGPQGVVDALGYEGTFTATDGPAAGMVLRDIGRFEPPSTAAGSSLQLQGTGSSRAAFHWAGPLASTPDQVNAGQTFGESRTGPVPNPALVPIATTTPGLTGSASVDGTLSCGTGSWTNDPSQYAYQWDRDGLPIPQATGPTYVIQPADAGHALTCRVTASNANGSGSSISQSILIAIRDSRTCPVPTGQLAGVRLGPIAIGETMRTARRRLPRYAVTHNRFDRFCLSPRRGIRAGYPSTALMHGLSPADRRAVRGRVILALTANAHYTLRGVTAGAPLRELRARLSIPHPIRVGLNSWYVIPGPHADQILKVRENRILEVGVASRRLTRTHAATARLLRSFG